MSLARHQGGVLADTPVFPQCVGWWPRRVAPGYGCEFADADSIMVD